MNPIRLRPIVAIALLCVGTLGAAADRPMYKKVEPDGTTTFTDQPDEDTEVTTGSPISIVSASPGRTPRKAGSTTAKEEASIERVELLSPRSGDTLLDDGQGLLVDVATQPYIDPATSTLQTDVVLDGESIATGALGVLRAPMPEPGTYSLQARVLSADGTPLAESSIISITVEASDAPD